jgi:hypothetical protein
MKNWEDIRTAFRAGASKCPYLDARWERTTDLWTLESRAEDLGRSEIEDSSLAPGSQDHYKKIATLAALRRGVTGDKTLWQAWLDIMRNAKHAFSFVFRPTNFTRFKAIVEGTSEPEPTAANGWDGSGRIASVFSASADFCDELVLREEFQIDDQAPKLGAGPQKTQERKMFEAYKESTAGAGLKDEEIADRIPISVSALYAWMRGEKNTKKVTVKVDMRVREFLTKAKQNHIAPVAHQCVVRGLVDAEGKYGEP